MSTSPLRDAGLRWGSRATLRVLAALAILATAAGNAVADEDTAPSPEEDKPTAEAVETADDEAEADADVDVEAEAEAEEADAESLESEGDDAENEGAEATVPDPNAFDLSAEIDHMIETAHGSASMEYRLRSDGDDTDQDIYNWLDLRLGDENKDRLSATFFARSTWDLDGQRSNRRQYEFTSIEDKYDSSFNTRLYTAYATYRPEGGPVAVGRFGRQYVYAAETFHVDGVWAESAVLEDDLRLTANVYGGVPVHLYESSPSGDWIAGTAISAEPTRFTRATLDYVHVTDDFEGVIRDDLTALRVWQRVTPWLNSYGRVSYIHGLQDMEARATASFDEEDLMVQASFFRQLEDKDQEFTTEFDSYYAVLHTLTEYDQYKLRAVKGFGDDIFVEVGADVRDADDEGTYNRDVTRFYAMPTFVDLVWDGSEVTLIGERWSGDGDRIETMGVELAQTVNEKLEVTVGTDYTMYGYDGFRDRERNHVHSFFYELRWDLTEALDLRMRYVREEDDEETYDVLTVGLTLAF